VSSEKNLPLNPSPASRRHGVGVRKSRYLCLPEVAAHCSASAACMRLDMYNGFISSLFLAHGASFYWLFSFSTCSYCTFNTILYHTSYNIAYFCSHPLSPSHTHNTHIHILSLPSLAHLGLSCWTPDTVGSFHYLTHSVKVLLVFVGVGLCARGLSLCHCCRLYVSMYCVIVACIYIALCGYQTRK